MPGLVTTKRAKWEAGVQARSEAAVGVIPPWQGMQKQRNLFFIFHERKVGGGGGGNTPLQGMRTKEGF